MRLKLFAILGALVVLGPVRTSAAPGHARLAAQPQWVRSDVPGAGFDAGLRHVVALSKNDAWAVGFTADHWNGQKWSTVPMAKLPGATPTAYLNSVAAVPGTGPTHTHLWAVGDYLPLGPRGTVARPSVRRSDTSTDQALIENWNGSKWSVFPTPNGANWRLLGVTALSSSNAWAVGMKPSGNTYQPLIMHWNGEKWKLIANPQLGQGGWLNDVVAISGTEVWAVGKQQAAGVGRTLIEAWNGFSWSVISSPTAVDDSDLVSLCRIPGGGMWAVGWHGPYPALHALIERYDGTSWSTVPPGNSALALDLRSITARGKNDAWAVGESSGLMASSVTEHWNGAKWKVVKSPDRSETQSQLFGVATILGTTQTWAAGGTIRRWTGTTWEIVNSPNIGVNNTAVGVAIQRVQGTEDIWVAGSFRVPSGRTAILLEHRAKGIWKRMAVPDTASNNATAQDIAVRSPNDVWLVGNRDATGSTNSFVKHWNGHTWKFTTNPPGNGGIGIMDGVAISQPGTVWVSGFDSSGPVFARWNGTTWMRPACSWMPASGELFTVAASSATNVWAAGHSLDNNTNDMLIVHWDGSHCTATIGPDVTGRYDQLSGIATHSSTSVQAVGSRYLAPNSTGLTARLQAGSWKTSAFGNQNNFSDVTTAPHGKFWLSGTIYSYTPAQDWFPTIREWTGSSWKADGSPDLMKPGFLYTISEDPQSHVAVAAGGHFNTAGVGQPIVYTRAG